MKIATLVIRTLFGLGFIVFGLNILHPFLPMPPPPEGLPGQFMAAMVPSHWMELVGFFQLLGGILVIIGRTAPLGLTILAPILVNILAFHLFLTGGAELGAGVVFSTMELFLVYAYRAHFSGIFTTQAKPNEEQ